MPEELLLNATHAVGSDVDDRALRITSAVVVEVNFVFKWRANRPHSAWLGSVIVISDIIPLEMGAFWHVRGRQDDYRHARSANPSLRYNRDRQHQLAL
jgi:hypothetical protein